MGVADEGFSVTIAPGPGPTTVAVVGDLDADTADQTARALDEALDRAAGDVVIDGSRLTFLDSAGVEVLVVARNRLAARGDELELRDLAASPRRIVEMLSLDQLVRVTDTSSD
jgi:anti-anti-sigma factor